MKETLTKKQLLVLRALAEEKSPSEIAKELGLSRQAITSTITSLRLKEMAEKNPIFTPSEKGREYLQNN